MFQGPCNGDSGGPLYINGQTADNGDVVGRTIAGVVSGGLGCGSEEYENYPQWFARVWLSLLVMDSDVRQFSTIFNSL
jgi:secreted trypsin-like serine protease